MMIPPPLAIFQKLAHIFQNGKCVDPSFLANNKSHRLQNTHRHNCHFRALAAVKRELASRRAMVIKHWIIIGMHRNDKNEPGDAKQHD